MLWDPARDHLDEASVADSKALTFATAIGIFLLYLWTVAI
jgi:hypothetical protein